MCQTRNWEKVFISWQADLESSAFPSSRNTMLTPRSFCALHCSPIVHLLLVICTSAHQASLNKRSSFEQVPEEKNWSRFEDTLALRRLGKTEPIVQQFPGLHYELEKLYSFPTSFSTNNVSVECVEDSLFYFNSLVINGSDWAVKSKYSYKL